MRRTSVELVSVVDTTMRMHGLLRIDRALRATKNGVLAGQRFERRSDGFDMAWTCKRFANARFAVA